MSRVYLDWNASAPISNAVKHAMLEAMHETGNPSSIHAEGRRARSLIDSARQDVAALCGVSPDRIVFTSGATEAARLILSRECLLSAPIEHSAVLAWTKAVLPLDHKGRVKVADPSLSVLQLANSETGIIQDLPNGIHVTDATQGVGKIAVAEQLTKADFGFFSSHKIGGPKGVGAIMLGPDIELPDRGGGQEFGRRSGTENLYGIAGFGTASRAAAKQLSEGVWERVRQLRDNLECDLRNEVKDIEVVGCSAQRLPNTSCFVVHGWKAETLVIQLDLQGIAVSSGSACTSGKVGSSGVLEAMGYSYAEAGSAIRVSIGPSTTTEEIQHFIRVFSKLCRTATRRRKKSRITISDQTVAA